MEWGRSGLGRPFSFRLRPEAASSLGIRLRLGVSCPSSFNFRAVFADSPNGIN